MANRARIRCIGTAAAPAALPCLLLADRPVAAALVSVTGVAVTLETAARPALGSRVTVRQPRAGTIEGLVVAHHGRGVHLALAGDDAAIGFALAAHAARIIARQTRS